MQIQVCKLTIIAEGMGSALQKPVCKTKVCPVRGKRSTAALLLALGVGSNFLNTAWIALNPRANGAELAAA
jgi:hypothetical protein